MKGIAWKMTPLWEKSGTFEKWKDKCGLNVDSEEEMEEGQNMQGLRSHCFFIER